MFIRIPRSLGRPLLCLVAVPLLTSCGADTPSSPPTTVSTQPAPAAARPPCDPDNPDPRTRIFYTRLCATSDPQGTITDEDVDFVNGTSTFTGIGSVAEICMVLVAGQSGDACARADAEFMALLLNVSTGRLCLENCTLRPPQTVAMTLRSLDAELSNPGRGAAECDQANALATSINEGTNLGPCAATPTPSPTPTRTPRPTPTPSPTPGPGPRACPGGGDAFVDEVLRFRRGPGSPHGDQNDALGPPDTVPPDPSGLVSLGVGGRIVLAFTDEIVTDGPGIDFLVYEGTFDPNSSLPEDASFEVAACPGDPFVPILPRRVGGDEIFLFGFDLADAGLRAASVLRITDDGDTGFGGNGFDVDAVEAINCNENRCRQTPTPTPTPTPAPPLPPNVPSSCLHGGRILTVGAGSSIERVVNDARTGDVIVVPPGRYPGDVTLPTNKNKVTLAAESTSAATLRGSVLLDGNKQCLVGFTVTGHVTLTKNNCAVLDNSIRGNVVISGNNNDVNNNRIGGRITDTGSNNDTSGNF